MTAAEPGRVLRHALIAWGLGHAALGRRSTAGALLVAEALGIGAVGWLSITLADTTLYLMPFLAGVGFLAVWAAQAIAAYRAASSRQQPDAAIALSRSAAIALAWLSVPLLAWSSGYWLVAGAAATPEAVLDRFVAGWTASELSDADWRPSVADAAGDASTKLSELCQAGALRDDCDAEDASGLRDVRVRVVDRVAGSATAVAEAVRFERRDTRLLGIFSGSELVPVPVERLLTLRLESEPATLGADRWQLVDATE